MLGVLRRVFGRREEVGHEPDPEVEELLRFVRETVSRYDWLMWKDVDKVRVTMCADCLHFGFIAVYEKTWYYTHYFPGAYSGKIKRGMKPVCPYCGNREEELWFELELPMEVYAVVRGLFAAGEGRIRRELRMLGRWSKTASKMMGRKPVRTSELSSEYNPRGISLLLLMFRDAGIGRLRVKRYDMDKGKWVYVRKDEQEIEEMLTSAMGYIEEELNGDGKEVYGAVLESAGLKDMGFSAYRFGAAVMRAHEMAVQRHYERWPGEEDMLLYGFVEVI